MCTFWLVEALVRAGAYDKKYLMRAVNLFENMLGYANHLNLFSEEIARSGELLGNIPQAFSHLALIRYVTVTACVKTTLTLVSSAAFNLDRVSAGKYGI
jgi:GH15 family glucan-1,4-alpha-glucosidase